MITLYQQLDKKFQLRLQKHKVTSEEIIKHLGPLAPLAGRAEIFRMSYSQRKAGFGR